MCQSFWKVGDLRNLANQGLKKCIFFSFCRKESQIFEEFVKEFFKYLETPEMSPRLMRKMILIVIDLADIALTQGKANSFKLFERIEIRVKAMVC